MIKFFKALWSNRILVSIITYAACLYMWPLITILVTMMIMMMFVLAL